MNLPRLVHIKVQKVFKSSSDILLLTLNRPFTQLITKKANGIQTRYKSTIPPPPGVTPSQPRAIPYARSDIQQGKPVYLLIIPIVTFGLGTWQWKRLKWKTELLKTIEETENIAPIEITGPINPEELSQMQFRKVTVKGTFDHRYEFFYGPKPCLVNGEPDPYVLSKSREGSYGYNLVTPLVLSDTGERILVNRGWISTKMMAEEKRPWSKTEGEQTITGLVRLYEEPSRFGKASTLKYRIWHHRDIPDMAEKTKCLPVYIDATADHSIPNLLWGGQTSTKLRNEHLTYTIIWYSISLATAAMYYVNYMKK